MSTTDLFVPSGPARERDQALIRDIQKLINGELSEREAQLVRFASAESIRASMRTSWRRPEPPERPLEFPDDDRELVQRVRFAISVRANDDDKRLANAFGNWRYAVWMAESDGASRILCLLGAVDDYQRVIDGAGGDQHLESLRDEVLDFLAAEWGINTPAPSGYAARKAFAEEHSRMEYVMPKWLSALRLPSEGAARTFTDDGAGKVPALGRLLSRAVSDTRFPREPDEDEER